MHGGPFGRQRRCIDSHFQPQGPQQMDPSRACAAHGQAVHKQRQCRQHQAADTSSVHCWRSGGYSMFLPCRQPPQTSTSLCARCLLEYIAFSPLMGMPLVELIRVR